MNARRRLRGAAGALLVGLAVVAAGPATSATATSGYVCGTVTGGYLRSQAHITDVRVGRHPTYDRFVIWFDGRRAPRFKIIPKSSATFWLDPSNRRVTLLGAAGLKVVLSGATGQRTYRGPTDLRPRVPQLREARLIGDFEAVTTWGLGLHEPSCKRVMTLTQPARLVIDVPH